MNKGFLVVILSLLSWKLNAQTGVSFVDYQKTFTNVNEAHDRRIDTIKALCEKQKITWPIKQMYLRSFKADNLLEVWVKGDTMQQYKLLNSLKVCAIAGKLGPKRKEGDKQVPEGFYYIDRFNPNSNYHLSLGINYPNISDKILSDAVRPGGEIYIHGDCVSIGCLAINDTPIEDLYILGSYAKDAGQDFIPIHIFPTLFNNAKGRYIVDTLVQSNNDYKPFLTAMQMVYYYFEKEKELPAIMVNQKGQYVVQQVEIPKIAAVPKKLPHLIRKYEPNEIPNAVTYLPVYKGGNDKFLAFVKEVSKAAKPLLLPEQKKAFVYTEYIVNTDGTVSNVRIIRGGNKEMNEEIMYQFETTTGWTPATFDGKVVACKQVQIVYVESD
jgi:murein L,D-transpeptidase YafK